VNTTEMTRVELDGLRFDCRPGTSDEKAVREVVGKKAYKRRDFSPRDGERWIDVGANIGAFSVWAAALGARVEAYEPDPESAAMARHNAKLNGLSRLVTTYTVALTADEHRGEATLHCNTANGNVWRNSLVKEWRGGSDLTVETWPIEAVWLPHHHVKLDAEGSEMPILEKYWQHRLSGLVFEWSFDIDPSLERFRAITGLLGSRYGRVRHAKIPPGETWQAEWFPPCRTVWCDY
jgi:FkbM family methyltransferase